MEKTLLILRQDLRITWRDNSTRFFLILPPILFLLLNSVIPPLVDAYPIILDYKAPLLFAFALQGGLMFGFVSGFLLLDEKDQNLLSVYQVLPLSTNQFLFMRMLFPFTGTFAYVLLVLSLNPLYAFSGLPLVLTALNFSLLTPVLALLIATLGKNKVEGLTYFKMFDLIVLTPFLPFFLEEQWQYPFMVVPTFWPVHGGAASIAGSMGTFYLYMGIGFAFQIVVIGAAMVFFKRRQAT